MPTQRFASSDLNAVRAWLRENGLECFSRHGWTSGQGAPERIGAIYYHNGEWHGVIAQVAA